jgi:gliding motility-associated-like protein
MPNASVFFTSLSAPSGLTHFWNFGDGNTSTAIDPNHNYMDTGSYLVTLSISNGFCSDTTQKSLFVNPPLPTIDFTASDTAGCGPFTVQFFENTQDATAFRWIFDDGAESTLPNPTHTFTVPGYYNVTLRAFGPGGSSFRTKDSFIFVYPKPNAAFAASPRTRYLPNALFTLIDGSADAVAWEYLVTHDSLPQFSLSLREANPQFNLMTPGYYNVRLVVTNDMGCKDTSLRLTLLYVAADGRVLVPNAFTPNGDNNNDLFKPTLTGVVNTEYTFQVFDRWGIKLFETHDINEGWDGVYMNKPAVLDAYIWLINGKFVDGSYFEEKGNVTLLR